jgi:hypothetical protein
MILILCSCPKDQRILLFCSYGTQEIDWTSFSDLPQNIKFNPSLVLSRRSTNPSFLLLPKRQLVLILCSYLIDQLILLLFCYPISRLLLISALKQEINWSQFSAPILKINWIFSTVTQEDSSLLLHPWSYLRDQLILLLCSRSARKLRWWADPSR